MPSDHTSRLGRPPKLTAAECQRARDLYESGMTATAVAAEFAVAIQTANRAIRSAGGTINTKAAGKRRTAGDADRWRARHDNGETCLAIAKAEGFSTQTVRRAIRQAGGTIRRSGQQPVNFPISDQQIRALYESGLTVRQVAEKVGASTPPVTRAILRAGGKMRPASRVSSFTPYIGPSGYMVVMLPADDPLRVMCCARGRAPEHRVVMARHLGRPLAPSETVHHRNGKRDDNRLSNLELWVSDHAPGQRVQDIVAHSVEMLRRYAPDLLA